METSPQAPAPGPPYANEPAVLQRLPREVEYTFIKMILADVPAPSMRAGRRVDSGQGASRRRNGPALPCRDAFRRRPPRRCPVSLSCNVLRARDGSPEPLEETPAVALGV